MGQLLRKESAREWRWHSLITSPRPVPIDIACDAMADLDADPQLLLSAFVRMVRRLFGTVAAQKAWVEELQQHALIGSAHSAKDALGELQGFLASSISSDSTSTQWICSMSSSAVATMCEAALKTIEADDAAGGVGLGATGSVRGIDFSRTPCVMG